MQDVFNRLMRRAPSAYQIGRFDNLTKDRLLSSIRLLRNGGIVGAEAWETVVRW
jgi:hypothetical protein